MLNPEWGLIVWTLITFGIAAFILWRYAFGPLQRVMDERRRRIQESIETADEARQEAGQLLEEYKRTLAQVRQEADELMEKARQAGDEARSEMLDDAKQQAQRTLQRAHEQIERDTEAAAQELRGQVADLTLLAAQKLATKTLSAEDHARLIEEALQEARLDDLHLGVLE